MLDFENSLLIHVLLFLFVFVITCLYCCLPVIGGVWVKHSHVHEGPLMPSTLETIHSDIKSGIVMGVGGS